MLYLESAHARILNSFVLICCALLFTPLWAPTLRGYPGVGGLIPIALAVHVLFSTDYLVRARWADGVKLGALLWCAFLFRRWYAFTIIALGGLGFIFALYEIRKSGTGRIPLVIRVVKNYSLTVLSGLFLGITYQKPLLERIMQTSYGNAYSFYQNGLLWSLRSVYGNFGNLNIIFLVLGIAQCIRARNNKHLFLLMCSIVAFLLFTRVQSPGPHHMLPFFFLILPIYLEGISGILEGVRWVRPKIGGALEHLCGRVRSNRWYLWIILVSGIIAAYEMEHIVRGVLSSVIVVTLIFYGGTRIKLMPRSGVVTSLLMVGLLGFGFYHTFPLTGAASLHIKSALYQNSIYPPLHVDRFKNYKRLTNFLSAVPDGARVAVYSASGNLNQSMLKSIDPSLRHRIIQEADVDSRSRFLWDTLNAKYVVVPSPNQTEELGGKGEHVITEPANEIRSGRGIGQAYGRIGVAYRLNDDVVAQVYKKMRPITIREIIYLRNAFRHYYPKWYDGRPGFRREAHLVRDTSIKNKQSGYYGLPKPAFSVYYNQTRRMLMFWKKKCTGKEVLRKFFVHVYTRRGIVGRDFEMLPWHGWVSGKGECVAWRRIRRDARKVVFGQHERRVSDNGGVSFDNLWAGRIRLK